MLTLLRGFMPKHKDSLYGIMVDYCLAKANYYENINIDKSVYWCNQACKYMLKRIDNLKYIKGLM